MFTDDPERLVIYVTWLKKIAGYAGWLIAIAAGALCFVEKAPIK